MSLSIIIPVFNEEKTIVSVLERIVSVDFGLVDKEIIIVDDASTDKTVQKIQQYIKVHPKEKISFFQHMVNQGKGGAVHTGIKHANGEYIVIQDADLEYDPKYIPVLFQPILLKKAYVVYGTRMKRLPHFLKEERTPYFILHYLGNRLLSLVTSMLYGQWITDMETCYKIFPKYAVMDMTFHAKRFDFEPEITAKLLKKGFTIVEISITTTPRNYKEGKKLIALKDGPIAFYTLLKERFAN